MQLDRRRLVAAGMGISGVAAATASAVAATAQQRAPRAPATAADIDVRPDTGKDVTASLQDAIDRAAERRQPLTLAAGRYIVRGLKLRSGSRIVGAGPATVLQHAGGPALLSSDGASDITIEHLTAAGGFALDTGVRALIELRRAPRMTLRDIGVETSPANGIMLERCGGVVTACRITGAAKAGIFSLDADGGLEISHNHLAGLGNNGILVWRSAKGDDGTIVAMNRIERIAARDGGTGENGNGINVFRAGSVLVTSNRIADCAFSAVRANSATDVQILANNIARMGEVAIFAEFAFEGALISGNLIDGAATGISVTNFDHGGRLAVVQGNLVRNLTLHRGPSDPGGYGIAVEADATITGNTIEGAPTAGMLIGWGRFCRDVVATGNVIRKSAGGITVTGDVQAGTVLLANNLISGASRGAIRAADHGRPYGEDLASAPPSTGRIRAIGNVVG